MPLPSQFLTQTLEFKLKVYNRSASQLIQFKCIVANAKQRQKKDVQRFLDLYANQHLPFQLDNLCY